MSKPTPKPRAILRVDDNGYSDIYPITDDTVITIDAESFSMAGVHTLVMDDGPNLEALKETMDA